MIEDKKNKKDAFEWIKAEGQDSWRLIALSFILFYFGEAALFWQGGWSLASAVMKLPFAMPFIYPLGYWFLFGFTIYRIQSKSSTSKKHNPLYKRFEKWKSAVLTFGITTGVVGLTLVVIRATGNITLGHTALFYALFITAIILGGNELNIGWMSAAVLWFLTALLINNYPSSFNMTSPFKDEDIWLGISIAAGFFLIGALPYRAKHECENS